MRKISLCLFGLVVVAAGIWRSAPSVGEGEVLVLAERAVAGPGRAWTAPWASRASFPQRVEARVDAEIELGQGSSWPVKLHASLDLEAANLGPEARRALLDGAEGLGGHVATWAAAGLAWIQGQVDFDPRGLLFEAGAVEVALKRALDSALPDGICLVALEASLDVPASALRANALAAARAHGADPVSRVLYIGLDGADWRIIDPLLARGELPVLAKLVREGVRADLLSYEPILSPLLWTTAITGRGPDAHGICDFTLTDSAGNQVPISSEYRKTSALWEILGVWGQSSAFVNFWATHPTEEMNGVLVSDIADTLLRERSSLADLPAGVVWPSDFLKDVAGLWTHADVPLSVLQGYVPSATADELRDATGYWGDKSAQTAFAEGKGPDERKTPPVAFLTQVITNSHNLERITEKLLHREDLGVVGVYFGEIDQVGHSFQHLAPPPHPLANPAERRFARVIDAAYRMQDAMLGRLIAAAGPDTTVFIHSDHGFRWGADRPREVLPFTRGQPVEWHRLQGVFIAAGKGIRGGGRVSAVNLYDIAPTILAVRGLPAADTMPGRVRAEIFTPAVAGRLPSARIADWEPAIAPRRYAGGGGSLDEVRQEAVEQLRALGYVGGAGVDEGDAAAESPASASEQGRPQVTYYRNIATWLMNQDRFAEAEQALLEANRIKPLPRTYSLLSESLAAQGQLEPAARTLEEGFRRFPDEMPASARLWMVELQLERADLAAARAVLAAAPRDASPRPSALIVAEGRIAEAAGDPGTAKAAYLSALEMDPREVRAAQRFAGLTHSAAERARLEPYIRRALEQDPRIEVYWQMLGLIRMDAGDPAAAADAFGRAADLQPGDEGNRVNEALAAMQAGQQPRAARLFETLAEQGSRQPAVWVNLGRLRAANGQWSDAQAAWERAVELGADAAGLREALADARARSGRRD